MESICKFFSLVLENPYSHTWHIDNVCALKCCILSWATTALYLQYLYLLYILVLWCYDVKMLYSLSCVHVPALWCAFYWVTCVFTVVLKIKKEQMAFECMGILWSIHILSKFPRKANRCTLMMRISQYSQKQVVQLNKCPLTSTIL